MMGFQFSDVVEKMIESGQVDVIYLHIGNRYRNVTGAQRAECGSNRIDRP